MSAPDISCYENLIGLYPGDCTCYNCDFGTSDSGLYLSDLLEPKLIESLLNCDNGQDICELMELTRDLAIRYFIADSNALLMQGNKLKRNPYYGGLGSSIYTKDLYIPNMDYSGVRIMTPLIRSGYLKIKKIGLLLNSTQAVTLWIYDRNGNLLHTLSLNATANTHTVNDITDITLPLFDEYLDYMEYFIFYQVNGFEPKNNGVIGCTSCQKSKPGWGAFYFDHKNPWRHWLNVGGFHSSGLPDFMSSNLSGSDYMNGLTFQIELGCLVNEVFCKDQLDFNGNTLAMAMAVAIQHKTAIEFVEKLLKTQNLNRLVMTWREQLEKDRQEWIKTYQDMITYITGNIDIEANDCFECKDVIEMIAGGIFA
jgi:hypothetical protein